MISEREFVATVDEWATKVKAESLRLLRDDVAAESCVRLAISIVEAKDIQRAKTAAALLGSPMPRARN